MYFDFSVNIMHIQADLDFFLRCFHTYLSYGYKDTCKIRQAKVKKNHQGIIEPLLNKKLDNNNT